MNYCPVLYALPVPACATALVLPAVATEPLRVLLENYHTGRTVEMTLAAGADTLTLAEPLVGGHTYHLTAQPADPTDPTPQDLPGFTGAQELLVPVVRTSAAAGPCLLLPAP